MYRTPEPLSLHRCLTCRTPTAHLTGDLETVLGLVIERPRHGYDLERVIEERGIREWTELGFSSIYYVLNKLQARGYVEFEAGQSSRSRRVYAATAGRKAVARYVEPDRRTP